jgi:DNA-damage-inducible protein J
MANHLVQARVSDTLKTQADTIFTSIGLTTSDAIRMFLQQSVNIGGLPFQPVAKIPNKKTIAAMEEAERKIGKSFKTARDLFKDLEV